MSDPLLASTRAQLALLKRGAIGASELLGRALERLDAVNPSLNAVVGLAPREALFAAARQAEQVYLRDTARPLEGLPITIKDAFDVAGMLSSGGVPAYRERIGTEDAKAVAVLREAGAIILGKSNVPVFSGDYQTYNPAFGTTNNPHDLSRSPGGSSGGAAVAVATGIASFELGSDLGGSIRWPCHATGVFGHKASWGLVSTYGQIPPPPERRIPRESELTVSGPIARSAGDLDMLMAILAGSTGKADLLAPPRKTDPAGLRVAVLLDERFAPVSDAVRDTVLAAAEALRADGAEVDFSPRLPMAMQDIFEAYALLNHAMTAAGLPERVRDRLVEKAASFAPEDASHEALQARAAKLTPEMFRAVQDRRARLRDGMRAFFARHDVILCPPAPVQAILHDHTPDMHRRLLDLGGRSAPYFDFLRWSSLATFANLPASLAPFRFTDDGLPAGIQIIAAERADRQAITVAAMLEARGVGFRAPPGL